MNAVVLLYLGEDGGNAANELGDELSTHGVNTATSSVELVDLKRIAEIFNSREMVIPLLVLTEADVVEGSMCRDLDAIYGRSPEYMNIGIILTDVDPRQFLQEFENLGTSVVTIKRSETGVTGTILRNLVFLFYRRHRRVGSFDEIAEAKSGAREHIAWDTLLEVRNISSLMKSLLETVEENSPLNAMRGYRETIHRKEHPGILKRIMSAFSGLGGIMLWVIVVGILAAIWIPNYISMQNRAKEANVRANAHTVQLAAEDYAVRNDGVYATSVNGGGSYGGRSLMEYFPGGELLMNPFTEKRTEPRECVEEVHTVDGATYYCPVFSNGVAVGYEIVGIGKDGVRIITLTSGS